MASYDIHSFLPSSTSGYMGSFLALATIWYVTTAFASWYRLRHVPGPFLASFSYLWALKCIYHGQNADVYQGLKKYGPVVRTGPNYVVTDDPAVFRRVNAARSAYTRDHWYSALRIEENDNMLSLLDTTTHDAVKAKLLHGYSGRDNLDIEAGVDAQLTHFIDVIRSRWLTTTTTTAAAAAQVKRVDFGQISRYFTLDIITRLAYGKAFGFMDAEGDLYEYTNSMDSFAVAIAVATDLPFLRGILYSPLLNGLLPKRTDNYGVGKITGLAHQIVKERFEKGGKNYYNDMVGGFMRHGATRDEAVSESIVTLLAGSDTTATAIRSTMLHIMATPTVYQRLKTEIREAIKTKDISSPITVAQAKQLPYLQAVILEGFRMRPPLLYGHFKSVPAGGDTLNGLFLPEGTAIGHNSVAMMRNEKVFGEDVDVFRPERFLECGEEQRLEMERVTDLVFGMGRWMCAGKAVAQVELNKTYFELLRHFDFQLIYPGCAVKENSYMLYAQRNMWVRITASTD